MGSQSILKKILSGIVIVGGGYLLFILGFMLAAFIINGSMKLMGMSETDSPPLLGMIIFVALIIFIFWKVFTSKLNPTIKATFYSLVLMGFLVLLGITLYELPKYLVLGIGGAFIAFVLYLLIRKKLAWQYYFATLYVSILGAYIVLKDVVI